MTPLSVVGKVVRSHPEKMVRGYMFTYVVLLASHGFSRHRYTRRKSQKKKKKKGKKKSHAIETAMPVKTKSTACTT